MISAIARRLVVFNECSDGVKAATSAARRAAVATSIFLIPVIEYEQYDWFGGRLHSAPLCPGAGYGAEPLGTLTGTLEDRRSKSEANSSG
jgi:hypothetical protein